MDDCCAVCAEPLEWVAYGSCGHREVCSKCVARLRFILEDRRCCICKSESHTVFVTKALGDYTKVIADFSVFPSDVKEGRIGKFWYHEATQSFFDDADHYKLIKAMCKLSCGICDKMGEEQDINDNKRKTKFRSIEQLKGHLYHRHKMFMCNLCLEGRKVFICEQKLYSRTQLRQHIHTGDTDVDGTESERGGFMGHPLCEFCRNPFYGENELYTHMSTEHYTCHLCQRQNPGQYDYYKNYDDLEMHFRNEHFVCENEACLAKKFVVFPTESELKRHTALEHGGHMSRSKRHAALQIPTSFRFRRSNENVHHRGRGCRSDHDSFDDHLEHAVQPSYRTAGADGSELVSSSHVEVPSGSEGPSDTDAEIDNFKSLTVASTLEVPSSRYLQAVTQNSRVAHLEESSFPPLPGGVDAKVMKPKQDSGSRKKTMAARLRQQHGGTVTVLNSAAVRPLSRSSSHRQFNRTAASYSSAYQNQLWPTVNGGALSSQTKLAVDCGEAGSTPEMHERNLKGYRKGVTQSLPSSSHVRNSGASESLTKVGDVRSANKSLVESIYSALDMDEDRYTAFKGITAEFRQSQISTSEYLAYVEQFGLSHLVLELARLCPDSQKQMELVEIYRANISGYQSIEKNRNKGKVKLSENDEQLGNDTRKRNSEGNSSMKIPANGILNTPRDSTSNYKTLEEAEILSKDGYRSARGKSLIHEQVDLNSNCRRVCQHDGDTLVQNCLALKNKPTGALGSTPVTKNESKSNASQPDRLPVRGVWRNGGGQRLVSLTQQDLIK